MKLHHTKYYENYKDHIVGLMRQQIQDENENQVIPYIKCGTDQECLQHIYNGFTWSFKHEIEKAKKTNTNICEVLAEWLQGLPINGFIYWNSEIVEFAQRMGSLADDLTEKQKEKAIEGYWLFMANQILKMFDKELNIKQWDIK